MTDGIVLAATVATAAFTGWAVWQRWRYTPRPHWTAPQVERVGYTIKDGRVLVLFSVMNVGDGDALNVEWATDGAAILSCDRVARIANGGKAMIDVWLPTDAKLAQGQLGTPDPWPDTETWDARGVRLTIIWSQHPSPRRRRHHFHGLPNAPEPTA
ncbi:hypothetical protein [Leifsonia xyli]|uniref:hypothetical protein n=1 Tax=Leifsonia xyli TaxID=1575 RepID=UPI0011861265|nr:hypothetical protein [Leifsonia xyli]